MDIACKMPFEAYLVVNPQLQNKNIILGPWSNPEDQDSNLNYEDIATVEENDELDLYFDSSDINSRMYFDALECCPLTGRILTDECGRVYCTPSTDPIHIYRSTADYDALRVDMLSITVVYNNRPYVSNLKIIPKQMSMNEWAIMRNDLEAEARGLAQDIVRRSIGLGNESVGVLPPDDLFAFLIINKNAKAIMGALLDIKDKPKYQLQKHYEEEYESKNRTIDTVTVRQYLRRVSADNKLVVPRRDVVYDIQENRLLKKIIKTYDDKIRRFIQVIQATLDYHKQQISQQYKPGLYDIKYIEGLENYLETAQKLKKVTNIVKNTEWFREVHNPRDVFIPHSFALDPRYGTLYRLYGEIKKKNFQIELNPQYSYTWKKSSTLYEMWCYLTVCRFFLNKCTARESEASKFFTKDHLFPFLESGTKITVEDDHSIIELVYDAVLPLQSENTSMYETPLYITGITGRHTRPDICINLYSKKSGWYIGSYIIECKYRKLNAFWKGSTWSSKEQIIAYHNDSKSPLFFNGYLDVYTVSRPVRNVFVFTPDDFGEIRDKDDCVTLLTFKPTADRSVVNNVCNQLLETISEQVERADNSIFCNRN